jgi:hypothetical protein
MISGLRSLLMSFETGAGAARIWIHDPVDSKLMYGGPDFGARQWLSHGLGADETP